MRTRRFNAKQLAVLTAAALFLAASAAPQDSSDRPPWARKPKSKPATTSTTSSTPENTSPPEPVNKDNRDSNSNDEPAQQGRIRVSVNLVNVLVSVLDDNNRPAPDLPVEAFQIFEEGVQQKIEVFESETKQPLDIALMIDASLSAHKEISFEQQAAAHFIAQVLRPEDHLSVFAFDENVRQIAGFSDNVKVLQSAVQKIPDGSGTSIYDALVLGSNALEHRKEDRRRVIILVTDGGETTSRLDFEAARKAAGQVLGPADKRRAEEAAQVAERVDPRDSCGGSAAREEHCRHRPERPLGAIEPDRGEAHPCQRPPASHCRSGDHQTRGRQQAGEAQQPAPITQFVGEPADRRFAD